MLRPVGGAGEGELLPEAAANSGPLSLGSSWRPGVRLKTTGLGPPSCLFAGSQVRGQAWGQMPTLLLLVHSLLTTLAPTA